MKYPMANSCLSYYKNQDNTYTVKNYLTEKEATLSAETVAYLRELDGFTHPYDIEPDLAPDDVDLLLDRFRDAGLIRERRLHKEGVGTYLYTLFVPEQQTAKMGAGRMLCFFLSWLVLLAWAPVMVCGGVLLTKSDLNGEHVMPGILIGTLVGAILHEISHAVSGYAYGATVFEMGAMVSHFVLPGAYVLMDLTPVKKKLRRAQINAAGIEMNLLLTGVFLCLVSVSETFSGMLMGCALANLFLGLVNMTVAFGLDGEHIMGNLIGDDNFAGKSIVTLLDKDERRLLRKKGINGRALITASYIMSASQVSLVVLLITNVIGVIIWLR